MARKLIVVARQHRDLYHYLRKRFAEPRIEVILDRRLRERRRQTVAVAGSAGVGIVGRGGTSTRGSTRDPT